MEKLILSLLIFVLVLTGLQIKKTILTQTPEISINTPNTIISDSIENNKVNQPYAPITVDNKTNFSSGWTLAATDSSADGSMEFEDKKIIVKHPGSNITSLSLYREGTSCIYGNRYRISLGIKSDISRTIQIALHDPDDWSIIAIQNFDISTQLTEINFEFESSHRTTFNGHISINVGNDNSPNIFNEHQIEITQLRYTNLSKAEEVVKVNQIGYLANEQKRCIFPYDAGDVFDVIDSSGSVVYSGAILNKKFNETTKETTCYGDFTNVTTPGTYYIKAQMGILSFPFIISNNTYNELSNHLLKTISLQRCGHELHISWAGDLSHQQCHIDEALIHGNLENKKINVTGGWHDAGDFGRYIKTGSKAVADLLFSYMYYPELFLDNTNSAQSNNGLPDILDEVRYELDWILKMQADTGGFYSRVLTENLPGSIDPAEDKQKLFVLPVETATTGDAVAVLALASKIYSQIDGQFSKRCLDAAQRGWKYLEATPDLLTSENPDGITGGLYRDSNDSDERFFAAISLWNTTNEVAYLNVAKELFKTNPNCASGTTWKDVGGFGRYLYLINEKKQDNFYKNLSDTLKKEAEQLLDLVYSDGYFVSILNYEWGSNGFISDNGLTLTMAYDIFKSQEYRQAAIEQLNYLLGKNSLNLCFVSGFGKQFPQNVHSRIALAHQTKLLGALVGGPNGSREDPIVQNLNPDLPASQIYSDTFDSYSTNEISIYWNSSLIHLISKLQ